MIWRTAVEADSLRYTDKKESEKERSIREGTSLLNKNCELVAFGQDIHCALEGHTNRRPGSRQ